MYSSAKTPLLPSTLITPTPFFVSYNPSDFLTDTYLKSIKYLDSSISRIYRLEI